MLVLTKHLHIHMFLAAPVVTHVTCFYAEFFATFPFFFLPQIDLNENHTSPVDSGFEKPKLIFHCTKQNNFSVSASEM